MPDMEFIGVEDRAKQVKAAANRLRWEIDAEFGQGYQVQQPERPGRLSPRALDEIAETVALLRRIADTLDAHVPEPQRTSFGTRTAYFYDYHAVGR